MLTAVEARMLKYKEIRSLKMFQDAMLGIEKCIKAHVTDNTPAALVGLDSKHFTGLPCTFSTFTMAIIDYLCYNGYAVSHYCKFYADNREVEMLNITWFK